MWLNTSPCWTIATDTMGLKSAILGRTAIDPHERGGNYGRNGRGKQVCAGKALHPRGWNEGSRSHPIDSRYINRRKAACDPKGPSKEERVGNQRICAVHFGLWLFEKDRTEVFGADHHQLIDHGEPVVPTCSSDGAEGALLHFRCAEEPIAAVTDKNASGCSVGVFPATIGCADRRAV